VNNRRRRHGGEIDGGYRASGAGNSSAVVTTARFRRVSNAVATATDSPSAGGLRGGGAADFHIVDTWNVGGLCGSGSHDVVIDAVEVPNERIRAHGQPSAETPLERFRRPGSPTTRSASPRHRRAAIDAFVDLATGTPDLPRRRYVSGRLRNVVALAETRPRGRGRWPRLVGTRRQFCQRRYRARTALFNDA
jgi:hypothetical protein